MNKYLLIESRDSEDLVVVNCDTLDEKYKVIEYCVKSEQLCAFNNVCAHWQGKKIEGKPIYISESIFDCEKERYKLLESREESRSENHQPFSQPRQDQSFQPFEVNSINSSYYQPSASVAGSIESEDYRSRIVNTLTCEKNKSNTQKSQNTDNHEINLLIELENLDTRRKKRTLDDTFSISSDNNHTQENNTQQISQDKIQEASKKRVKHIEKCDDTVRENLIDIWSFLLDMKSQIDTRKQKKSDEEDEESILIGGKYKVLKSVISYGLMSKDKVEGYFKYLIRKTWHVDEYINRNVSGRNDKQPLDKKKLEAFIHYAISSWNDHHSAQAGMNERIIDRAHQGHYSKSLCQTMSSLCCDTRKRANRTTRSSQSY